MSDPYDWTKHWWPTRLDGMRVVEATLNNNYIAVTVWLRDHRKYNSYEVDLNGRVHQAVESPCDLIPIVRTPVLAAWTHETFPLGCWLAVIGSNQFLCPRGISAHGVFVGIDNDLKTWSVLSEHWCYTTDSVAPRTIHSCGTLETPT